MTSFEMASDNTLTNTRNGVSHFTFSLANFNCGRLEPKIPSAKWREEIVLENNFRKLEFEMLEREIMGVQKLLEDLQLPALPHDASVFMDWFEALKENGPGQNDTLFEYLEHKANVDEMKWFIQQEVASEAGFDDLAALTQIKLPPRAKLEVARNYWDEMGRGHENGMHGPMLSRLAEELNLKHSPIEDIVPESLALANVLLGFALNRSYAYHSIGALGVVELTAPRRAVKVHAGLKRLGLSNQAQRYYLLHSTIDIKHSADWNREVIKPLVVSNPKLARPIAEGALVRLEAGARCFLRYRKKLKLI